MALLAILMTVLKWTQPNTIFIQQFSNSLCVARLSGKRKPSALSDNTIDSLRDQEELGSHPSVLVSFSQSMTCQKLMVRLLYTIPWLKHFVELYGEEQFDASEKLIV